jgi:hypothetical protein
VCLHTAKRSARGRKKGRKSKKSAKVGHDSRGRKMADTGKGGESKAEKSSKYRNIHKGGQIAVLYNVYILYNRWSLGSYWMKGRQGYMKREW